MLPPRAESREAFLALTHEADHLQLSGAFIIPPESFLAEFSPVRLTSPDCAPDYQETLLTWRSTPLVLKAQSRSEFPDHLIVLLSSLRLKRPLLPSLSGRPGPAFLG